MAPKLRFVRSVSLSAVLLGVGACGPGTAAEQTQAGVVSDPQPVDLERRIGDAAELAGAELSVTMVEWRRTLTDTETGGFLVVDVAVRNTGGEPMPYSSGDWSLLRPDGTSAAPSVTSLAHLGRGRLAPGKGVEGTLVFGLARPDQPIQVVYQPAGAAGGRVRWRADKPLCLPAPDTGRLPGSCPVASA